MTDEVVEVVEMTPEEADAALRKVAVVGEWNHGLFQMDYFLDMVDSAVHKGYMHWGTQTETLDDGTKRSRVVFINRKEAPK